MFSLFKTHVWNYYAVILLFYVPFHIIFNAMSLIAVDHKQIQGFLAITHVSLQTLIAILLIYILPLIFLMRENISAIPLGLKFLFKNLISSLLLIVLALMHTVIMHPVIKLGLPALLKINVQDNFMIFIAYAFFYNFVLFYINFMIFTAASKFLMKESPLKEKFTQG
ncbi:MAG TPA: hypothetical protein DCO77_07175 [Nitrospiraceae bacterium]|nr:hypothetical protein [Nitrospiraceae bacterium]